MARGEVKLPWDTQVQVWDRRARGDAIKTVASSLGISEYQVRKTEMAIIKLDDSRLALLAQEAGKSHILKHYRPDYLQREAAPPGNWIERYRATSGELPLVPEWMAPLVLNYQVGMRISKDMRLTPTRGVGMQFLCSLSPGEERQLKQLAEWLGKYPEDYDYEVLRRRMGPPRQSMGLIPKRFFKL